MFRIGENFNIDIKLPTDAKPLSMIWVNAGNIVLGKNHEKFEKDIVLQNETVLPVQEMPIRISKGFWLSEFPVTQIQWKSLGDLPIQNKEFWLKESEDVFWADDNYPVSGVSWMEAMMFCRELNIKYKEQLPVGYHFSLPTELQWEYTSKSGLERDKNILSYDDFFNMHDLSHIKEVGKRSSNDWGFYDMLGNIKEVCYDIVAYYAHPNLAVQESYPVEDGKIVDWVGNKDPENFIVIFNPIEERIVRGGHASVYREARLSYKDSDPLVSFRVCLRPTIDWEHCDLNDPWLAQEGINILGD